MLFDTHCHLNLPAFDADRQQVLQAARQAGVQHLLIPAVQRHGWENLLNLCASNDHLYSALGLHPLLLNTHADKDGIALGDQIAHCRPTAIGEIGLDYLDKSLDRKRQQILLEIQLEIAEQYQLPVVLHVRKAHDVMLQTLRRYRLPGGFCHAFNGSLQQADQYLTKDFKLGFGGILTYPNASKLHRLARELPLSAIVLETDAPDMAGIQHRYQRNSPTYLLEVAKTLAQLRGISIAAVATNTTRQALDIIDAKKQASAAPAR